MFTDFITGFSFLPTTDYEWNVNNMKNKLHMIQNNFEKEMVYPAIPTSLSVFIFNSRKLFLRAVTQMLLNE